MKKITTILGISHNEFDNQTKDILNDISEEIEKLARNQDEISKLLNRLFLKQHAEVIHSSLCDACHQKAKFTTINIPEGTYKSFCDKCLSS